MKKKIVFVILLLSYSVSSVSAQLGTMNEPPRLRDLQPMLVEMIYLIWALGGLFFTVLLMWIGFQYMTSAGDPQKKEELKKKGKNWLIGLVVFFLGYPIVSLIYDVIGIGSANPDCYEQVSTPGFHFFFPDVCTDPTDGTRTSIGERVDLDVLSETERAEVVARLVREDKCLFGDIVLDNFSAVYMQPNDTVVRYYDNNDDAVCEGTTYGRNSTGSPPYSYIYNGNDLEEESGNYLVYGSSCSTQTVRDSVQISDRQNICCYSDGNIVVPSQNARRRGEPIYVRLPSGLITYFWYDETSEGGGVGSCDCENGRDDDTNCPNFTETPQFTID